MKTFAPDYMTMLKQVTALMQDFWNILYIVILQMPFMMTDLKKESGLFRTAMMRY